MLTVPTTLLREEGAQSRQRPHHSLLSPMPGAWSAAAQAASQPPEEASMDGNTALPLGTQGAIWTTVHSRTQILVQSAFP